MPGSLTLSAGTLYGFLLTLARVGGAFIFVPMPGVKGAPEAARAVLAAAFALALSARWPVVDAAAITAARLAGWVVAEASIGLAIGVAAAVVLEAFSLAAQLLGLQAGYGYASMVDPTTDADSGVLVVFAQLMSGLMFFALGLDRDVLRLFASSLDAIPSAGSRVAAFSPQPLIDLGAALFSTGVRLALPVIALLLMLDVALALLGRLNQQLQLISLAFPAKMLIALLAVGWIAAVFPRVVTALAGLAWAAARRTLGI